MLTPDQTDRHRQVHRAIHFLTITQRDDQELMAVLPYAALFLGGAKSEHWIAATLPAPVSSKIIGLTSIVSRASFV